MSEVCEICGRERHPEDIDFWEAARRQDMCGRRPDGLVDSKVCYRLGYERTLARAVDLERQLASCKESWRLSTLVVAETEARADRSEAEFSACKALLIAAQKRAERAEAERAEAEARAKDAATVLSAAEITIEDEQAAHAETMELWRAAEQRASEARAALEWIEQEEPGGIAIVARALAALPVEPARRQVTENANAMGTGGCAPYEPPSAAALRALLAKAAPTPWAAHPDVDNAPIRDAEGHAIAFVVWPDDDPDLVQMKANARLLASAPVLLAELARCSDQPAPSNTEKANALGAPAAGCSEEKR